MAGEIVTLLTSLTLLGSKTECPATPNQTTSTQVVRAVDGDTLLLRDANNLLWKTRLVGIDTPETHYQGKDQGEWGFRAANRLAELAPRGAILALTTDRQPCDSRGRVLGHVSAANVYLNGLMASEGLAVNYCVAPNYLHCDAIGESVAKNIREKIGFLADPSVELPYLFREEDREEVFEYFIGDRLSKLVYSSAQIQDIPVENRVFFYSRWRIRPPYRLASP